jgi:hypothetical protein
LSTTSGFEQFSDVEMFVMHPNYDTWVNLVNILHMTSFSKIKLFHQGYIGKRHCLD